MIHYNTGVLLRKAQELDLKQMLHETCSGQGQQKLCRSSSSQCRIQTSTCCDVMTFHILSLAAARGGVGWGVQINVAYQEQEVNLTGYYGRRAKPKAAILGSSYVFYILPLFRP